MMLDSVTAFNRTFPLTILSCHYRLFKQPSLFSVLVLPMTSAYVSPSDPVAGTDYEVIATSAPSHIPAGKIEVLEFFWYSSPHDYALEPKLQEWRKKQDLDVVFKRVPVAFSPNFAPQQRLYHALDALGVAEEMMGKLFEEIQHKRNTLLTPQAQADFVADHGMDRQKFLSAYNSFKTAADVQRDNQLVNQYCIQSVPTLVVQGQYKTSPARTQSLDGVMQVLEYLVSKVRSEHA
ncbi:unnamed protein product [Mortierella alpina]